MNPPIIDIKIFIEDNYPKKIEDGECEVSVPSSQFANNRLGYVSVPLIVDEIAPQNDHGNYFIKWHLDEDNGTVYAQTLETFLRVKWLKSEIVTKPANYDADTNCTFCPNCRNLSVPLTTQVCNECGWGKDPENDFRDDLAALLNRYSKESDSNTPDLILAQYLCNCLKAFDLAVSYREVWYGRDTKTFPENVHNPNTRKSIKQPI